MKFTNKHNLPQALVRAVTRGWSRFEFGNTVRATTLMQPPQITHLTSQHWEEMETDVSELVNMLFGTALHLAMEKSTLYELSEVPLMARYDAIDVTGTADAFEPRQGVLTDYKTCSSWKIKLADFDDWTSQLSIYRELLIRMGYEVKGGCRVVAFLKDWRKNSEIDCQVQCITIAPNTDVDYVSNLVNELYTDKPRPCTDKERWVRGGQWALMRKGRKTAVKLYKTRELAEKAMSDAGNNHWVEDRPKQYMRCAEYCAVSKWCPQWQGERS